MSTATWLLVGLSAPLLALGFLELLYYPLAVLFERRRRRGPVFDEPVPIVSIIVPAYNEDRVIAQCIESILDDRHPRKELLLVDDGSTDETLAVMRRYAGIPGVTVISQANAGKAAALNAGLAMACGEILVFVDADGIFAGGTITELLTGFDGRRVGAVCGNDEPVNLDRPQTHLLALLTHGTAFVRRALARINCLTIVSGNCGAVRRSVLDRTGGFTEGFIGEDLELTWRVHRAGYAVNFRPRAVVYAEVPSTARALWKQRIRWTRGHLQTARLHRDLMFSTRFGRIGWYLPLNVFAMLVAPVLQAAAMCLVVVLAATGNSPISPTATSVLVWLGLGTALAAVGFAVALDRAWRDLRFVYILPAMPVFSLAMSAVVVWAIVLELRGAPARWNKLARTGVVSRDDAIIRRS